MTKEEKCSNSQKGRIVIHKGNDTKRVYSDQLDGYLSDGWERGFSEEHNSNNGKAHIGKNIGNSNGFKKGQSPWNKGKKAKDFPKLQAALNKAHTKFMDTVKSGEHVKKRDEIVSKAFLTRMKNNTLNTSKPEELLYEKLLKENETKTIYRNYKCDRYPYHCDFYIVEDDLFIELNAHWTHGGRPYDANDFSCQQQLELWKDKAKTSKFYLNAIETWTKRDVEKAKCAKKNNLKYWVIY